MDKAQRRQTVQGKPARTYTECGRVIGVYQVPIEIKYQHEEIEYVRPRGFPNDYGTLLGLLPFGGW